ncbi:MAG: DNA polymerase domain-containing protein, partial [Nitrososphaeraceae archaeon]
MQRIEEGVNKLQAADRFPDLYVSPSSSLVPVKPKPIRKILSFDLEWSLNKDEYGEYPILAAGFSDSHGYNQAFLLEDFLGDRNSRKAAERSLLFRIISIINKYDWSIGFYSTGIRAYNPMKGKMGGRDSDLIQLHRRLVRYGLDSPIYISELGLPYLVGKNRSHIHLDAYKLFSNQVIKTSVYNGAYTSNDLDTISRVILGSDKGGKFEGLSGSTFESIMDLEEKRKYVLQDAKLLMDCVSSNNYEILKVMNSLSVLTDIPFKTICNSKGVTKIWTVILDDLVKKELSKIDGINGSDNEVLHYEVLSEYYIKHQPQQQKYVVEETEKLGYGQHDGPRYIGGWVFEQPNTGEYRNIHVFDITSLYPTIIVNNNISFETVDCSCCTNNPLAKVPDQIVDGIDNVNQHVCLKFDGILTKQIETYMSKRIEYKQRYKEANNNEQGREY